MPPYSANESLDLVLRRAARERDIPLISVKRYAFDEALYDQQYGYSQTPDPALTASVHRLLHRSGVPERGIGLELGCGTGVLSLALRAMPQFSELLITDPSLTFVEITRRKVQMAPHAPGAVLYAALGGDDLGCLPHNCFSAIALRYTLHHILDWRLTLREAHRILMTGGLLAFEEPFAEAFLMQASLIHFYRMHGQIEREEWFVAYLKNTVASYLAPDDNKAAMEDKHFFVAHEIMSEAQGLGFDFRFYPNSGFESFGEREIRKDDFLNQFVHNCEVNLGFPEAMVRRIRDQYEEVGNYLRRACGSHDALYARGLFILKKANQPGKNALNVTAPYSERQPNT